MTKPQPPDQDLLVQALEQADRDLDAETAAWVKQLVTTYWHAHPEDGPNRAQWTALGLLHQAAYWRKRNVPYLPEVLDLAAEAFLLGWRDEITVRTEVAEALGLDLEEATEVI